MAFPQNAYPNYTNFAFPSFPQEIPAPDIDPDAGDMICVTYSRSWTAVLMSACSQLTQLSSWQGTDEEKKLAVMRATNLQAMLQKEIGCDMGGCCYDTVLRRITPDGQIEISINGGDWIPDPADPRGSAPTYPPPVMDEHHTKCDAATNVNQHFNDIISETSSQLGGTGALIEVAAAIAAVIFAIFLAPETIPEMIPVVLPLISAIVFLGQSAFDAYFSSDVHDQILCAIYCTISDAGTFTDSSYAALISKLSADLPPSPAKDYFVQIVQRVGLPGMNDYAAIGESADADCASCTCGDCPEINVTVGVLLDQGITDAGLCWARVKSVDRTSHFGIEIAFNPSGTHPTGTACVIYDHVTKISGVGTTVPLYHQACGSDASYPALNPGDCMSYFDLEDYSGGTGSECVYDIFWQPSC
ncbi:MAG TPA: hypothetical protein VLK33_11125 [Terriglobales bacterium]|nr:hypothetical protein [Terriglobales bacterium]